MAAFVSVTVKGAEMPDLTNEVLTACALHAQRLDVSEQIHPDDFIFWAIHDSAGLTDKTLAAGEYFESGYQTALFLKGVIDQIAGLPRPFSLLDFAGGYGRVARHIKNVMPDAQVTTCDVHDAAVAFNRSIGLSAVLSSSIPEEFNPGQTFDAICAISFFTHMPAATWARWLKSISCFLARGGVLIFTTHGRAALKTMGVQHRAVKDGFLFFHHSEQKDLALNDYGSTVSFFEFVFQQAANAGLRVIRFQEAGLGYQDLIILTPASESSPAANQNGAGGRIRLFGRLFRLLRAGLLLRNRP